MGTALVHVVDAVEASTGCTRREAETVAWNVEGLGPSGAPLHDCRCGWCAASTALWLGGAEGERAPRHGRATARQEALAAAAPAATRAVGLGQQIGGW